MDGLLVSTSPSSSVSCGGSCRFTCQVLLRVSGRLRFVPCRHGCSCATSVCARVDKGEGEGEDEDEDEGEGEDEDEDEDGDEDEDAHEHREGLEHERHRIGVEWTGNTDAWRFPVVCEAILETQSPPTG